MGYVHRDCGGTVLLRQNAVHYSPVIDCGGNGCYDTEAQEEEVVFTDDSSLYCEDCGKDIDEDEIVDENAEEAE